MGILNINLGEDVAPELHLVDEGEYKVQIDSMDITESKEKKPMIKVVLVFPDDISAQAIFQNLMLPVAEDDVRTMQGKVRRLRDFCKAFQYPYENGVDTNAMTGLTGWAQVGVDDDKQYGRKNVVRRWIIPAQ